MPAPSRAHLLLPTRLGLVHYDLLEDSAFLGPSSGSLLAAPGPFPEAKVAVTFDATGYVVRALPGEPPADVNGAPADGARLKDGDRIRLGGHVAMFRAPAAARAVVAAAAPAPATGLPSVATAAPGSGTAVPAAPRPRRAAAPL